MTSFDPARLRSVQLVPVTAMNKAGGLDLEQQSELFRRSYDAGIRVIIPAAGSAEFHTLSEDEIVSLIDCARTSMGDDAAVVVPLGSSVDFCLRLGRRAIDAGADATLVMPLNFPYISNAGARDYYQALLDGLDCPTMLYKKAAIPSDPLLLDLADHPNLVGVKYAVNDMNAFNQVVEADQGKLDWFCGSAERFAPFYMLAGATGYTSGAGNLCPRLTLSLHSAMVRGEWEEAIRLQRLINPIEHYRGRDDNSYNISFLKYAIRHIGLEFGTPRPPQRQLTEAEKQEIDEMIVPILAAERELAMVAV